MCDDEWLQFCNNDYSSDNFLNTSHSSEINIPECPEAEHLYISTKSKIGYLNKPINLADIFWKIPITPYHFYEEGVIKKQIKMTLKEPEIIDSNLREYENVDIEDISKKRSKIIKKISIGISSKDMVSYRCKKKGAFYNCFVIIFRVLYDGRFKEMHVKIFNTGKMEIPGVPKDDLLELLLKKVLTLLNSPSINLNVDIKKDSFETVLINSNFNCGFNINRESLVDIIKYTYKLSVSYDPCSYPGIMCKYYYYLDKNNDLQDGRLYKYDDEDTGKREKPICISFMIFRTGSVLIVGKCHDTAIIYMIYNFIKDIFVRHYANIYAPSSLEELPKSSTTKKKIKKKKIVCYKQNLSEIQNL